jgi:drug/metabolite transporter (DMT)-like permease
MRRRRIAIGYLVLQAIAIAAWWGVMMIAPSVRSAFAPSASEEILLAFAPSDALVVALGLYVAVRRGEGRSDIAGWLIAGAMSYATLFTITMAARHLAPTAGAVLMTPAAMASCWAAAVLSRRGPSSPLSSGASP